MTPTLYCGIIFIAIIQSSFEASYSDEESTSTFFDDSSSSQFDDASSTYTEQSSYTYYKETDEDDIQKRVNKIVNETSEIKRSIEDLVNFKNELQNNIASKISSNQYSRYEIVVVMNRVNNQVEIIDYKKRRIESMMKEIKNFRLPIEEDVKNELSGLPARMGILLNEIMKEMKRLYDWEQTITSSVATGETGETVETVAEAVENSSKIAKLYKNITKKIRSLLGGKRRHIP